MCFYDEHKENGDCKNGRRCDEVIGTDLLPSGYVKTIKMEVITLHQLKRYGVSERFLAEATLHPEETLARVTAQYRGKYKIVTEQAALLAEVSGKLRYETVELAQYPTVGDYVMVTVEGELAVIHRVLRRKSLFVRRAVGVSGQAQPVGIQCGCGLFVHVPQPEFQPEPHGAVSIHCVGQWGDAGHCIDQDGFV